MMRARIAVAFLLMQLASARAEEIVALTADGVLERLDSERPATIVASVPVTGLQTGERLRGIDFRPATGALYGVGDTSRVYHIALATGVATPVGAGPFNPALAGAHTAIDFDPTADRLRTVGDAGQNLRLNPDTGTAGADSPLAYAQFDPAFGVTPHVVALAHSDDTDVAQATTLYGIDSARDTLVTVGAGDGSVSPSSGAVFTVGALGVDATDTAGFDISGQTGVAYAALTLAGSAGATLCTVNLSAGTVTPLGTIGAGEAIVDLAVLPAPLVYDMVALRNDGRLLRLDTRVPTIVSTPVSVTGLQPGETLRGIDYRPSSGVLYGLGDTARLYRIDPVHGTATAVSATPFTPAPSSFTLGITFDPVGEHLRLLDRNGQNLDIDADAGTVAAVDTPLAFASGDPNAGQTPQIGATTYGLVIPPATTATLYAIDTNLDVVATLPNPSNGQLTTVAALNGNPGPASGLDVTTTGIAFGLFSSTLTTVDLATGDVNQVGADTIGGGSTIRRIAAVPPTGQAVLSLVAPAAPVREGQTGVITITRSGAGAGSASVDFTITGGTATLGSDYTLATGTLTFADGETSRDLALAALTDQTLELFETVTVAISNPVGAVLGTPATATANIADLNDGDGDGFPDAVEVAAGTDPNDAASTPFGGQPAGPAVPLSVGGGQIRLNFKKTGVDGLNVSGSMPSTQTVVTAGQFIVDVGSVVGAGGVIQVFTVDAKGRSTPKGLHLAKPRKGLQKFTLALTRGTFAAALAGAGLSNADAARVALPLDVSVYYLAQHLEAQPVVLWSAKAGRKGVGVVQRTGS